MDNKEITVKIGKALNNAVDMASYERNLREKYDIPLGYGTYYRQCKKNRCENCTPKYSGFHLIGFFDKFGNKASNLEGEGNEIS